MEKEEVIIGKPRTSLSFPRTPPLSCLRLAKPINIQFSPGFVMKAAADCALGATNLTIYGDRKIPLKGLGDANEEQMRFCKLKVLY